ncbi:TPA: serine/threonine-protein kinase MARK2-like [Bos taurus]|nr:TPA: serine/threonine-protein kinase MARK2-like [Bos taurus]
MAISVNNSVHIENYDILQTIGEGQFAKVKLARHVLTKEVVAIKVIQKTNQSSSGLKEWNQEINSLKTVSHPNIVKLLEVIDTEETLFIVMEYVSGGDLFTYLEAKGRLTEGEARGLFRQLVSALQHCHQRGVVHRDLKLGNLLLDANNNVKISDFGLRIQDLMAISVNNSVHIENYDILQTIGEGQFAKVKLARHVLTKEVVAIKVIQKTNQSSSGLKEWNQEINSLKTVSHANIVKLLEVIDTEEALFIVMEYVSGGDLFTYLEAKGRLTEGEARGLFRQLVSALQHCHQRGVVHRDLKLGNLLLDANNNVKISDFGLSNQWHPGKKLDTFCGSPAYMAPELFLRMPYTGPEVDVWSLGVILYTMVTGSLPFRGQDFWELQQRVLRGQYHVPKSLSNEITDLLDRMLTLSPTNRGTLDDVWQHPWVNMGQEEPLPPACEEHPGMTGELILGWCRDQIQGLDTSSISDMNVPKVRVRTIIVRPAVSSDLSSQEHMPSRHP